MKTFNEIITEVEKKELKKVELHAVYDNRQSFYKKAMLVYDNDVIVLYSYSTPVLALVNNEFERYYIVNDAIDSALLYSNTTLRHIKEVLKQCYQLDYTKKDIIQNNAKSF